MSSGCANCFAEAMSSRFRKAQWGPAGTRVRTGTAAWAAPLKWNRRAERTGRRERVFCASMCDVFEDHPAIPSEWRWELWELIRRTPNLDWLLLTKRPENVQRMWSDQTEYGCGNQIMFPNVWIGTSVENQATANERIPHLLRIPARVRFLSAEPLLGPLDLRNIKLGPSSFGDALTGFDRNVVGNGVPIHNSNGVHWVICGGESGPNARPTHPDWARSLRDQCQAAGVAYFLKQWGQWGPGVNLIGDTKRISRELMGAMACAPDGTVAPLVEGNAVTGTGEILARKGKAAAGRLLDGREWNQFPDVSHLGIVSGKRTTEAA